MANAGNATASSPTTGLSTASSEIFVTAPNIPLNQEPQSLNFGYTIFGQLTSGANILSDIENAAATSQILTNPVKITSATITPAPSTSVPASQFGVSCRFQSRPNFTGGSSTITVTSPRQ